MYHPNRNVYSYIYIYIMLCYCTVIILYSNEALNNTARLNADGYGIVYAYDEDDAYIMFT